jgi:hypothetical protein
MNRTKRVAVAAAFAVLGCTAWAQPLPVGNYFQQFFLPRTRLAMHSGRIVNTSGWHMGNTTMSSPVGAGEEKEQVTLRSGGFAGNTGSIEYQRTNAQEEFTVEVNSEGAVRFRRTPKGNAAIQAMQFTQLPGEAITFVLGPEGKQQVCRAPTLWHLLLFFPDECRPLVSVLEQLRRDWQIGRLAAAVEAELLKAAGGARPNREHWAALVQQLGDDQFMKREAAERQLRAIGAPLLGYLHQLDLNKLDAEQASRVRRVIKSLSRQTTDDTPEQVAAWLAEDPQVWLALLSRPDEAARRTAARQLASLLGEDVGVDPAADPATQKDQREALRVRIERSKPAAKKR